MKSDNEALSVGGYLFFTEKDAKLARTEREKIEYLEARLDYSSPESIKYVYEKAIHERLFATPVGLDYLKQLQDFLLSQPEADPAEIMDIPLYINFGGQIREKTQPARVRIESPEEKRKSFTFLSVILNVLLVVAIFAMFYISFVSEHPNILNYERAVIDKYASWEQNLIEREQNIREKEKELKLDY